MATGFAGLTYSTDPIFQKKTKSGFCHNFYIMYHATDSANVEAILTNGFNLSVGPKQMLGDGVYCSLTINKAYPRYGRVAFRILVYTGKTYKCTTQADPLRTRWQTEYASCWVPPNSTDLNTSGLEENCIKSRNQIRILGIAKGFDLLPPHVQAMTTNTEGENTNNLSRKEKTILKRMRCEVGESWTMIEAAGSHGLVMDVSKRDSNIILWQRPRGHVRKDNQLFKVWHDRTIRSKLDPEKKICIRSGDGDTLYLGNDDTEEVNKFCLKVYEKNIIKNNNYSRDPSLNITASNMKKGGNVVAQENDSTAWWFVM